MKRNFEAPLIGFNGEPLVEESIGDKNESGNLQIKKTPILLRNVAIQALMAQFADEQNTIGGEEKFKRYKLVGRIHDASKSGEMVEIDSSELDLIKRLIGKGYGASVVGPAYSLLEADPTPAPGKPYVVHDDGTIVALGAA